jgi:hypothetical protein
MVDLRSGCSVFYKNYKKQQDIASWLAGGWISQERGTAFGLPGTGSLEGSSSGVPGSANKPVLLKPQHCNRNCPYAEAG